MDFSEFAKELLVEYSPNDPIPELNRKQKGLGVFMVGPPVSGKTTFINNFIRKYQSNIYVFSSDWLSDLQINQQPEKYPEKEPGKDYVKGTSGKRHKYMKAFFKSSRNDNFVLDTTGISPSPDKDHSEKVEEVYNLAKQEGYDVIFIHLIGETSSAVSRAKKRNQQRDQPNVDISYVKKTYTQPDQLDREGFGSFGEGPEGRDDVEVSYEALSTNKAQSIISYYGSLGNDPYYIVVDLGRGRVFYKYENGQMKVRVNDRYVPVNKYWS